jgi:hypothetical protein
MKRTAFLFSSLVALLVIVAVLGFGGGKGIQSASGEDPYVNCNVDENEREGDHIRLAICESGKPLPPELEQKLANPNQ